MSYERLKPQLSIAKEQIDELKRIVPEAFADGKINWETLKEALGEYLEDEGAEAEHFGLFWPGKWDARRMAAIPSKGTLVPVPGEGIDEETTRNIFIEGENLEVLKLLQKSYAGRIKMIYIDPPYNTGQDFVYEDDFREPLEEYLRRTGQVDEEGKPWTTNTRADGRFHSKWLSMMYPRLRMARAFLNNDGAIFVSVDDNEVHNLRQIMGEVFGEENFVGTLVWEKKKKGAFLSDKLTNVKEYIVVFSKERDSFRGLIGEINTDMETYPCINAINAREIRRIPAGIESKYAKKNFLLPKGEKISVETMNLVLHSDLVIKNGRLAEDLVIEGNWRYTQELMEQYAKSGELYITQDLYLRRIVTEPRHKRLKDLLARVGEGEEGNSEVNLSNLFSDGWGSNEDGNEELRILMGEQSLVEYPKPSKLLLKLIASLRDDKCIIMDFFAGSGTMAHSVFELNKIDNGARTFLLIQLPEPCKPESIAFKAGYKNIAEICTERIRRVSKKLKDEGVKNDLGFKVFKLTKSNYKIWRDYDGTNLSELEAKLDLFETPLVDGWKPENLLTEILLLEGFPLDSKIEKLNHHKKNTVQRITSEFCEHRLLVCLDKKIEQETIQHLNFEENDVFVCLDSALSDQDKMRLADVCKLKTI